MPPDGAERRETSLSFVFTSEIFLQVSIVGAKKEAVLFYLSVGIVSSCPCMTSDGASPHSSVGGQGVIQAMQGFGLGNKIS